MAPETALNRPVFPTLRKITFETIIIAAILVLAIFSRFYDLGARVMAHDEVNHVVPSYELYLGNGYVHDPMTHGPLQFHLIALSYFILGDSDFSSRVPAAVFSVAAIVFVIFGYRRYLGRTGALIAGFLFLISPFMLFYGRYARNEGFIELWACMQLFAILRYLEKGDKPSLFLLIVILSLQVCTKETAYIYIALALLFLGFYFLWQLLNVRWRPGTRLAPFLINLACLAVSGGIALFSYVVIKKSLNQLIPADTWYLVKLGRLGISPIQICFLLAFVASLIVVILLALLFKSTIRSEEKTTHRTLDLLLFIGTIVAPLLVAFPVKMMGWDPMDYSTLGQTHTLIYLLLISLPAFVLGLLWNWRTWLQSAGIFFGIFTVFYTTFFTNAKGFFTGLVGSLGYWLQQQGVNRGGQPSYYYVLVQIPFYEFLAAIGLVLAIYFTIRYWRFTTVPSFSPAQQPENPGPATPLRSSRRDEPAIGKIRRIAVKKPENPPRVPVIALLIFWSLTSLVAYSLAGEKMPWLTVHILFAMLLAAGWGLGFLVDSTPWKKAAGGRGKFGLLLIPCFLCLLILLLGCLLGDQTPFQGKTQTQLQDTNFFLFVSAALLLSIAGLIYCFHRKPFHWVLRVFTVAFFAFLALTTIRTSIRASFINYDDAREFLVYAHAARGPKDMLAQIEEISFRITKGKNIDIGYDNDALYPFWWYLRDYPNAHFFAAEPTREIADYEIVIAGEATWAKVEPLLKDNFVSFEYMRLWWPTEEYRNLTWTRIWEIISKPEMRQAVFNLWWNRDYSLYASLTNNLNLTLETWSPNNRIKLYIRKDIVSQMWEYGVLPTETATLVTDPYAASMQTLSADLVVGGAGDQSGQFNAPRGVATAPDGSIYIADSRNNRIQHFSSDGILLGSWGTFDDVAQDPAAPGGTFNEPWGVAVAPDGTVFVTDTWNHRIQKFTANGQFIMMWGYFGQDGSPDAFYGPRGIAIGSNGRVYVTDTGNKRVVVFDLNGNYITQFGSYGTELGQLDEPVGIALDADGNVYVADTWNQRVEVFEPDESATFYMAVTSWPIQSWTSTSIEDKPFLTVDPEGRVFVSDSEQFRVLEFSSEGTYLRSWGGYSPSSDGFGSPMGLAFDAAGHIWVADAGNNDILRFTLPPLPEEIRPLPAVPYGAETLAYRSEERGLFDASGNKIYSLDEVTWSWLPVIPDAIAQQLPTGATPIADQLTTWLLEDANQVPAYRWDLTTMQWLPITSAEQVIPTEVSPIPTTPAKMECPFTPETRLSEGQMAQVMVNLNVRSDPAITVNGVARLSPGDLVLITDGPQCWQGSNANFLFWLIQLPNGITGWVAEGDLQMYYLEPYP
jgi:uncharacterized protein (TIGR03663 family)